MVAGSIMKSFIKSRKFFLILILAEVVFLVIFLLFIRLNRKNNFKPVPLSLSDFTSDIASVNEDGSMQVYSDDDSVERLTELLGVDETNSVSFLLSRPVDLKKGYYTLQITYDATFNQSVQITSIDQEHKKHILSDDMILERSLGEEYYQFSITDDITDLQIKVLYNNKGYFCVHNISLIENDNGYKRAFVFLLFFFLMLDLIIMLILMKNENRLLAISIVFITIIFSLPLFHKGLVTAGGDVQFHLLRIEGIVHDLRLRIFPTRVSTNWLGGYGYPASIFYGDIFLYFPAVLRLFGFTVSEAFEIFIFSITLLTTFSAVLCFSKIFNNKISVVISFAYIGSSYRLTDLYDRFAIGEYISFIFYPILALAMVRIFRNTEKTNKDIMKNGLLLAFGMSGMVTSHILSAEMTVFALIVTALIFFKRTFTKSSLLSILYGAIGTLFLSAYFLIPLLDYYQNVPVKINYYMT